MRSELELGEVFVGVVESSFCVSSHLFVCQISPDNPSVNHVRELQSSSLLSSELPLQNLDQFSSLLDVGHIIAGGIQESGAFDSFSKFSLNSSHENFADDRGVEAGNCNESFEFSCQSEGFPDSPAETDRKIPFVSLRFEMSNKSGKGCSHLGLVESLGVGNNLGHVGGVILIDFSEDFRKIDVVPPLGVGVGDALVSASEGSEDVSDDDQHSAALADVVDRHSSDLEHFPLGFVGGLEGGPGSRWAASGMSNVFLPFHILSRLII